MKKLSLLFIILIAITGFYFLLSRSESLDKNIESQAISFQSLNQGWNSDGEFVDKENFIIENSEEWEKLWDRIVTGQIPKPELTFVDFKNESVIAVFQGQKGSGGYSIKIDDIRKIEDFITIFVTESEPGQSCVTLGVISEPFHIIKLPIVDLSNYRIDFRREVEIVECE